MRTYRTLSILLAAALLCTTAAAWAQSAGESARVPDRTVLPIQMPAPPTSRDVDVRNSTPPPRYEVKAPAGAPNVIVVLVDDLGFAGTGTFGGPIATPNFDRIANGGLYYNNFHTTAVCSPTRAALKSGRNHHVNNMGGIIETGTSFPGNTGQIPSEVAPVAEMLRLNGYATAAFGKWHETAAWEASVAGPFDRWPTRQGFDKFYGFLGGETNHWAPFIYDGDGLGKGGQGTLYVNDSKVGEGRIERTQPMIFSADETADVGIDLATPVVERLGAERASEFNGRIPRVTVSVQ